MFFCDNKKDLFVSYKESYFASLQTDCVSLQRIFFLMYKEILRNTMKILGNTNFVTMLESCSHRAATSVEDCTTARASSVGGGECNERQEAVA